MNNLSFLSKYYCLLLCLLFIVAIFGVKAQEKMVYIPGGEFTPFYGGDSSKVVLKDFKIDVYPVTNGEYIKFLKAHPKWRKSKVVSLFADRRYLFQFTDDLHLKKGIKPSAPVTNVSWFTAKAYCQAQGKRLPLTTEWEYVGQASKSKKDAHKDKEFSQIILRWYEQHNSYLHTVGSTFKNYFGVWDMHGLVWEWTADFNSVMVATKPGTSGSINNEFVCGGASINAANPSDYAAFMRYAFRTSLKGRYCIKNLGFRCAKSINK